MAKEHYWKVPEGLQLTDEDRKEFGFDSQNYPAETRIWCRRVSTVKTLIRRFGGSGITEHYERNGTMFEVTSIQASHKQSNRVSYNRHL